VMDNYGTHKVAKVRGWLARHPRYHVHFTPTSGSLTVAPENGASMAGERGQRCGYAMARWRRTGARFEVAPF
jgi:hypothetical protein